jgi:hypothetical protein
MSIVGGDYYAMTVWSLEGDDKWICKCTMTTKFRSVDPLDDEFITDQNLGLMMHLYIHFSSPLSVHTIST